MTYTHLTTDELVLIESYYHQSKKVKFVADSLKRTKQTIYNVYNALNDGLSILDYYQRYKANKKKCGRRPISLSDNETEYIQKKSGSRMDTRCDSWSSRVSYFLFCADTL